MILTLLMFIGMSFAEVQPTENAPVAEGATATGVVVDHSGHDHGVVPDTKAPAHHDTEAGHAAAEIDGHGGGHGHAPHLDGKNISLLWLIPFLGILLSIAIFPLVAEHFWHHNYGKVSLFWGLLFVISFFIEFGPNMGTFYLIEVYTLEFIPFIVLLLALFTVAGGIRLKGELVGAPKLNAIILILGSIFASWMGTTGAAMLLIRPIIRANAWRKYQVHTIVFFIFMVANVGGSLTPLGDPPLFLGFLKGVDFFWTTTHMFSPMVFALVVLLLVYFAIDTFLYSKETNKPEKSPNGEKLSIDGKANFFLLPCIVGAVLLSSLPLGHLTLHHVDIQYASMLQVGLLLLITFISLKITTKETREGNSFTWEPIVEVAKLFATIFITMVPAIAMLKEGVDGPLAAIVGLVTGEGGEAVNSMYFWCTGVLSSFLDNAPTYVVFFNTAGGDAAELMTTGAQTLLAISMGAVFMGANTYIGNAPNFMVKSIAEENKIKMPSFFGYMIWSILILIPLFILTTFVFF